MSPKILRTQEQITLFRQVWTELSNRLGRLVATVSAEHAVKDFGHKKHPVPAGGFVPQPLMKVNLLTTCSLSKKFERRVSSANLNQISFQISMMLQYECWQGCAIGVSSSLFEILPLRVIQVSLNLFRSIGGWQLRFV